MKNYIIKHNNDDLFDGAFDFFRPFYQASKDLMKTDIEETDTAYNFDIEMPGYSKENLSVSYEDGYISVAATKKEEDAEKKFIRHERNVSCQRTFYVGEVEESAIKAKYENGVLSLVVPKLTPKKQESHIIAIE